MPHGIGPAPASCSGEELAINCRVAGSVEAAFEWSRSKCETRLSHTPERQEARGATMDLVQHLWELSLFLRTVCASEQVDFQAIGSKGASTVLALLLLLRKN